MWFRLRPTESVASKQKTDYDEATYPDNKLEEVMTASTLLRKPPTRAGLTTIRFDPRADPQHLAHRNGDLITILRRPGDVEIHSLQGGNQLLVHDLVHGNVPDGDVFCGTDEQPFATAIDGIHLQALRTGGEAAFYRSLMPPIIRWLQALLGPAAIGRQGDIWWAKLCDDPSQLSSYRSPTAGPIRWGQVDSQGVLGTRHRLTGAIAGRGVRLHIDSKLIVARRVRLVSGRLAAPDHADRKVGVALLTRTPGILPSFHDKHGQELLGD